MISSEHVSKIKVLVVDDSALIRKVLAHIIDQEPDMTCVGAAPDPLVAREMIKSLNPDVITLDIEMPKMDGLDFLERLMRLRPMPVVMVSSLTERGSEATLRALELGAVDFVSKPKLDIASTLETYGAEITTKLRVAASARVRPAAVSKSHSAAVVLPAMPSRAASTERLIIVGASTGGTEAIKELLSGLPADAPGVLIAQHMPAGFTKSFAERLNSYCRLTVKEAEHGERVLPGHVFIAPGHSHLLVKRNGANYVTELSEAPPVNRHRPSVDVLFRAAANYVGKNAVGVILTGMGKDGAAGMLEMKRAGAVTYAQDEETCVVFGMPKEAIALGGVDHVVALSELAGAVIAALGSARELRI
jgi:two-component system chemotaxis response regulator CheB